MPNDSVVVVGAGPVGSLLALMLAKRGVDVQVYERRPDMRLHGVTEGRSIAALCFAAALQCTSDGIPGCGECRSCSTTMAGTHADVRRVIPEGLSIGVDDMVVPA